MKKITYFAAFLVMVAGSLVSCSSDESGNLNGPTGSNGTATVDANGGGNAPADGRAGSLARFAINGNHLYAVDDSKMHVFDISNPGTPQKRTEVPLSFGVETIFPYNGNLFIGTMA